MWQMSATVALPPPPATDVSPCHWRATLPLEGRFCCHGDQCHVISSEDRATFIKSMNDNDASVNLADEMKASSQRRFEMKNEAKVDETATKRKKSGSTISAYMEQKLGKKSQEHLHIMLLQALIWGNISFNFVNNPFFIRILSKLRPSYCLPTASVFSLRIFNTLSTQIVVENMEKVNNRIYNGDFLTNFQK